MPALTAALVSAVIKERYPQRTIKNMFMKSCPLFGRLRKIEDEVGEPIRVAFRYASGGRRSASAASAFTVGNTSAARYSGFAYTMADNFAAFALSGKDIAKTRNDKGALVALLEGEINAKMDKLRMDMCFNLYRDAGGAVGQIVSGADGTTLTLASRASFANLEVGDVLVAGAAADGSNVTANTGTIGSMDRDALTITVAGGGNWHGDFDDADYIFHVGDATAKISGLAAHFPLTAPGGSDDFFGVNRSIDVTRHAGNRYEATAAYDQTIDGAIGNALAENHEQGGAVDEIYANPLDWRQLSREIEDKTTFQRSAQGADGKPIAKLSYSAIKYMGPGGEASVFADPFCPRGVIYALTSDTITLRSYVAMPGFLMEDDQKILREAADDAYQGRMGTYWQMMCDAPGWNSVIDITDVTL